MRHFFKSFVDAGRGIFYVFREERNFALECIMALLAVFFGYLLSISPLEYIFIILVSGMVLGSEILNTILEEVCDEIEPHHHPVIGKIKDMMAAVVLLNSFVALIIGLIIFLPRLF